VALLSRSNLFTEIVGDNRFYVEGDKTGIGMENVGRPELMLRIGSGKAERR